MDKIDAMKEHIANGGTMPIQYKPQNPDMRGVRVPGAILVTPMAVIIATPSGKEILWTVNGSPSSEDWVRRLFDSDWRMQQTGWTPGSIR